MEMLTPAADTTNVFPFTLLTPDDIRRFSDGTHYTLYEKLGSHPLTIDNQAGTYFAVWAPNALAVTVIGNFNHWDKTSHVLFCRTDHSGIWEGFIPGCKKGELYKYHITGPTGVGADKGDPYAYFWEVRPATASITWNLAYEWNDKKWMTDRKTHNALNAPWSVYEVQLLSWMRPDANNDQSVNTYKQAITLLVPYVKEMGFTHVELMPIMEHPFDGSWGYQGAGYFAPTSRFGSPQDFMALIDAFHQAEIGVILDWVPSHFPYDAHGLYMFDGTHTYEHSDMKRGYHPDWNSYIFDYGKAEVKSFLISSARYWVDKFHADGIRVDGVSSMLILSYSRSQGQWEPNQQGEDKNLEAIAFLKSLNETIFNDFPDVQMIAEESTDWQGVSKPTYEGGLGFGMKWMMGWMHDTLEYFKLPPAERPLHQNNFTLSMEYYYHENFMLALSHDEVVYGKLPMLAKMPGNEQEKFANLRLLYTYMFTHPGGKLLFMGDEFGSSAEWDYKSELPWKLLQEKAHRKLKDCVRDLCLLLRAEPALHELQFSKTGFEWVDKDHQEEAVISYRRKGLQPENDLLVILNMSDRPRKNWPLNLPGKNKWLEIFNSAGEKYETYSGVAQNEKAGNHSEKGSLDLPALSAIILKQTRE